MATKEELRAALSAYNKVMTSAKREERAANDELRQIIQSDYAAHLVGKCFKNQQGTVFYRVLMPPLVEEHMSGTSFNQYQVPCFMFSTEDMPFFCVDEVFTGRLPAGIEGVEYGRRESEESMLEEVEEGEFVETLRTALETLGNFVLSAPPEKVSEWVKNKQGFWL